MKKIISIIMIAALLPFAGASAQEQEEKQYLPEAGDWALGIDVVPVLRYIGNAFNGNTNNQYIDNLGGEPFVNQNKRFNSRQLMPDVSIQGKYMITDEWGVRANVGLMFRSIYDNRYATDDKAAALNPLSNDKVVDKARYRKNGMSIMAGGEYRKGTKRVQGVFGMGVLFFAVLFAFLIHCNQSSGSLHVHELSMFFTTFVMLQFWNLFNAKAFGSNHSAFHAFTHDNGLLLVLIIILAGQWLIVTFGGRMFRTDPLSLQEWLTIIAGTSLVMWAGEIWRGIKRLKCK